MMPDLPTINQAYRILLQEQRHKDLSKLTTQSTESIAFNVEKRKIQDRNITKAVYSEQGDNISIKVQSVSYV